MLRAVLLLLALVAPSLAVAQITVSETSDSFDDQIINIAECEGGVFSNFRFTWQITSAGLTSGDLRVSDQSGCPQRTTENAANTSAIGTFSSVTGTTDAQSAPTLAPKVGVTCGDGQLRTVYFCAVARVTGGGSETSISGTFQIDGTIPEIPVITKLDPGDGALEVAWDPAANADRYFVSATPVGQPQGFRREVSALDHRITGLTNGVQYEVRVTGVSIGGNESPVQTAPPTATPVPVNDFWRLYRGSGGQDEGGCTTGAGAGALALLALVPLVLRRKRS
jgi:Synergist-CTERM protein sorting domain-containing protein